MLELLSNALIAQRRALQASAAIAVAAVTTIVGDLLLIPPYGGMGAAIATTGAYSVGAVAVGVVFCRQLGCATRLAHPALGRPHVVLASSAPAGWSAAGLRPARRHAGDDG